MANKPRDDQYKAYRNRAVSFPGKVELKFHAYIPRMKIVNERYQLSNGKINA